MSETARSNRDMLDKEDRLDDQDDDELEIKASPGWYILTESVLIIAAVPSLIFFIFGIANGLLLLIQQDDHLKWVATKKLAAVVAGKSADSVSDHMEDHLTASTTVLWVLLVIYIQILFTISRRLYPFWGLAYLICLSGGMIYHIVGIIWVAEEDCTDTDWFLLGLSNTIIFYVLSLLILIGSLIWFFIGNSKSNSQKVKPQARSNVEESEANILPREENKEDGTKNDARVDSNGEENKEGETEDKNKQEPKDDGYDLDEEEIY